MSEASRDHESYLDLCAGSVLGALEPGDRVRLDKHLETSCDICERELAELREAVLAVAESIPPVAPDPSVKSRVLARIRENSESGTGDGESQPWRQWSRDDAATEDASQLFLRRSSDGDWEETGVDGILVRSLFVDRANDRMTAMFRMAPGTSYIPHVHAGYEECFVLEGDLKVGDEVMQAGDYQRAPAGSTHGVQSTENGCLLLISSSLTDEAFD